ncbi:MAG: PRC-barrel domain-containing protein [Bradyrhizobium sp.]|nr:PRC-barrel domain-containing protein [Bradyrhizobium sp.]
MKLTLTAAALATVLAAPAFAQAPATAPNANAPAAATAPAANMQAMPAGQTAAGGFLQAQTAQEWRGSNLIGASVYGPDNNSIGSINDVIVGSDGNVRAAVIGVGGFLGIGQKDVAVPFSDLNVTRRDNSDAIDRINVSYTKEQLEQAPSFAYYEGSRATTTGSGATPAPGAAPAGTAAPSGTAPATPAR